MFAYNRSINTQEEFVKFQQDYQLKTDSLISGGFNPGKLFVFRYEESTWAPSSKTDRPPLLRFDVVPLPSMNQFEIRVGMEVNLNEAIQLPGHIGHSTYLRRAH